MHGASRYLGTHGLNTTRASDDATPVVFVSPASGRADGKHHASNWYDVIEFGHLDALLAGYGVWGLQCLGDIYEALGDKVAATQTRAIHRQAVIDFNTVRSFGTPRRPRALHTSHVTRPAPPCTWPPCTCNGGDLVDGRLHPVGLHVIGHPVHACNGGGNLVDERLLLLLFKQVP